MKGFNKISSSARLAVAALFGGFGGNSRKGVEPKTPYSSNYGHGNFKLGSRRTEGRRLAWNGMRKQPGCKGDRSMSCAQQGRAATKRNNIRKNPRGAA